MKPLYLTTAGLLAALLAGGAAAQFNTDALKKMQKEGHKIVEEQQAAEAAQKSVDEGGAAPAAAPVRAAYRSGANLCLDSRAGLAVRPCNSQAATQQWALDADGRLVASDGRCVDGATLGTCAASNTQKWVHDGRSRLRNQAQQCLQPRAANAGAPVTTAACSGAAAQVWTRVGPGN
jgi:hypothetical protein